MIVNNLTKMIRWVLLLGVALVFPGCSSEPGDPQERKVWQQIEEQGLRIDDVIHIALMEDNKKGILFLIDEYDLELGSGAYRPVLDGDDFEMVDFLRELGVPIEESEGLLLHYLENKNPTKKGVLKLLEYGAKPTWKGFVLLMKSKQYSLAQAYINNESRITPPRSGKWDALYEFADYDTLKLAIEKRSSDWYLKDGGRGLPADKQLEISDLSFLERGGRREMSPIKKAAQFGNSDLVRFFIDIGGDVNYLDPLSTAIEFRGNRIDDGIAYLIEHGAYLSNNHILQMGVWKHKKGLAAGVKQSKMKPKEMALVAAYGGSVEALKYLKKKFNLNYSHEKFSVAAAISGDTETFEYVAATGAPLNKSYAMAINGYSMGATPVYTASKNAYEGILKSLHEHGVAFNASHLNNVLAKKDGESVLAVLEGISRKELNKFGERNVYYLVEKNELWAVSKMIEHGLSVKGMKLLQVCYNNKFNKLAELLKENGAV